MDWQYVIVGIIVAAAVIVPVLRVIIRRRRSRDACGNKPSGCCGCPLGDSCKKRF